jgi:hypothetical protein
MEKEIMIMNRCTDKTGRWPDTLTDVSPDKVDAFLAHANVCAFHEEKLRAEDEGLRSVFRLARGLDTRGRILQGTELKKTIEEQERRHAVWDDVGQRMKLPFKRIYLSNCGEDIAGSGKFYDFRRYEGDHLLDLPSGLQIWGVLDDEGNTGEVLLGVYSLIGVRHTGAEKLLPLGNGYTVGLRVEQIANGRFKIEFRCVESEVLNKGQNKVSNRKEKSGKRAVAKVTSDENSFFGRFARQLAHCFPRYGFGYKAAAATIALCVFLAGTAIPLDKYKRGDGLEIAFPKVDPNSSGVCREDHSSSATTLQTTLPESMNGVGERQSRQRTYNGTSPPIQNSGAEVKANSPDSIMLSEPPITSKKVAIEEAENDQTSTLSKFDSHTKTDNRGSKNPLTWCFQSGVDGDVVTNRRFVVHTGSDKILGEKLFAEINQRAIDIVPLNNPVAGIASPQPVTAVWGIVRQEKSVTVEITLTTDGESKFLSFRSDGACPEQACEKAVKDAVSGVFAVIDQNLEAKKDG